MRGIIKTINIDRGFGFIKHGDNQEIFFHFSYVSDLGSFNCLERGTWVQFDIGNRKKGPMAINVKRVID